MRQTGKWIAWAVFALYWLSWILPIGYRELIGYEGAEIAHDVLRDHLNNLTGMLRGQAPVLPLELLQSVAGILLGGVNILYMLAFALHLLHVRMAFVAASLCLTAMAYWGLANGVYFGWGYDLWLACGLALTWLAAIDYLRIARIRPAGLAICAGIWPAYIFSVLLIVLTALDQ